MAGVTDTGWESKLFQEVEDSINAKLKVSFGDDFATTPDSPAGQWTNTVSAEIKDLWDMGSAVEDTQNRDSASGIYLDYLAGLVGLTRQLAQGATGDVLFFGEASTTVLINTACKDQTGKVVLTTSPVTLNRANCYTSTFSVKTLQAFTDYTLTVEGIESTINSGASATELNILNALKVALDANVTTDNVVDEEELTITVTYPSSNNELTTTNSENLNLDVIGSLVPAESSDKGGVEFYAETITKLVTPNLGVTSVINPLAFASGRELEADDELRVRMQLREQSTGTATKPSIEASISEVNGVSSVLIVLNDTLKLDLVTGVPAKSFETFVTGGANNDIAEVLWRTKPLFGQTYGDVEELIVDDNGDTQSIKFSRPSSKFAWVRVTYSINDEEYFPSDGEDQMKNVVTNYGNSMLQGEDFEPTKFYCPLYTVGGVWIQNIEIAVTDDLITTPVYQTDRIPVGVTTSLSFDQTRVSITT